MSLSFFHAAGRVGTVQECDTGCWGCRNGYSYIMSLFECKLSKFVEVPFARRRLRSKVRTEVCCIIFLLFICDVTCSRDENFEQLFRSLTRAKLLHFGCTRGDPAQSLSVSLLGIKQWVHHAMSCKTKESVQTAYSFWRVNDVNQYPCLVYAHAGVHLRNSVKPLPHIRVPYRREKWFDNSFSRDPRAVTWAAVLFSEHNM